MTVADIRKKAKELGIKPGNMKKTALIRVIQTVEGNSSCFNTAAVENCEQANCCWRKDCLLK